MVNSRGAKVAISYTNEKHRSPQRVYDLVKEALDHLGGIAAFVKTGQTVLIKPNQTVYYSAEEGCTTDPLVVGALIRLAKQAGAAKVQVAESSGGFFSSMQCMKITGMAAVAEREGAELIDLGSDDTPNRTVQIPNGRVIQEVPLPAPLLDADVIIDVPKAKNHHIEPISGALKNWVGTVDQQWRDHHHGDLEMIGRFMDIMMVSRPTLCVVDALIAEEGESRGLGVRQPIDFVGVPLEDVRIQAWAGHTDFNYLPLNFLVGKGVTLPGTIGHVKSVLDSMMRRGQLKQVIWLKGTPTIMIGEIDDPLFEEHLKEGPYVVFDDAAKPKYKSDPRVYFVPGHPVLQTAMPELVKGLGVDVFGKTFMKWQQFEGWGKHNLAYGTTERKAITLAKPALAAGLAVAAIIGIRSFLQGRSAG